MDEYIEIMRQAATEAFGDDPFKKVKSNRSAWGRFAISAMLRDSNNHKEMQLTFADIGRLLNKNHATIISAVKKHFDYIETDKLYQLYHKQFIELVNKLYNNGWLDWRITTDEQEALGMALPKNNTYYDLYLWSGEIRYRYYYFNDARGKANKYIEHNVRYYRPSEIHKPPIR